MDIIFEIILEFTLNELIEASRDKNNSKLKRFILLFIITLFFLIILSVLAVIVYIGIYTIKKNVVEGILTMVIGLMLLVYVFIKSRKAYITINEKKSSKK
jgi:quinol-cytochrome oxidoreductase complex cytochrome b subunit